MKEYDNFFKIFDDPDKFVFQGINTSKYFYDYCVSRILKDDPKTKHIKQKRKTINFFRLIGASLKLIYYSLAKKGEILFYGSADRISINKDQKFDFYNYRIIKDLGKRNTIIIQDKRDRIKNKVFSADLYIGDFSIIIYLIEVTLKISHKKEIEKFCRILSEQLSLFNISYNECKIRILKFYSAYVFYKFFLKMLSPKGVIVICHYSKEALIACCKKNKIKVIELMHGQILPEHPYYNNNKITDQFSVAFRHLLPDFIGVFGNYWKNNLIEGKFFDEKTIFNVGYYVTTSKYPERSKDINRKTILISSSPQVQMEIINYLYFLKKNLNKENWKIIIKPHPSEDPSNYLEIIDNQQFYLETQEIYKLLSLCDIHIGVLSTVVFEAIQFDLKNYVLYIERYKHYCDYIVSSGVAEKLELNQVPDLKISSQKNKGLFFEEYEFRKLLELIDK